MPKVDIGGVGLDYIEQGSGQPLIFVHGSLGDLRLWGQQIDAFAERYRVVAYTRRYHHGSEDATSGVPLSVAAAADDLVKLIETMGLAPAHLAGLSFGAFTVLLAAVKRPELVRTLVLGEPPVADVLTTDPDTRQLFDDFMTHAFEPRQKLAHAGDLEGGVRVFVDGAIAPGALDMLPEPVRQMMMDNASTMTIEQVPTEQFGAADAAKLKMPVLLVSGEQTPEMFNAITAKLRALLPHAEHVVIPDASHVMNGDNAPAYNAAVLAFLERHA